MHLGVGVSLGGVSRFLGSYVNIIKTRNIKKWKYKDLGLIKVFIGF
jgi:Na+/H+ antiporter NhaB